MRDETPIIDLSPERKLATECDELASKLYADASALRAASKALLILASARDGLAQAEHLRREALVMLSDITTEEK